MRVATRLAAKPAPPLELQGPAPIFPGLMSSAPRFGNGQALHKHEPKVMSPRADWSGPPAPGHYDVGQNKDPKFPSPRASSFGGNLSKEDRSKTGLHGIAMKGRNLPGPNSYSVDEYVKTKSRVPTFKFGASSRGALNGSAISPPPPRAARVVPTPRPLESWSVSCPALSPLRAVSPPSSPGAVACASTCGSHRATIAAVRAPQTPKAASSRARRARSGTFGPDNAHSHPHALELAKRARQRSLTPARPLARATRFPQADTDFSGDDKLASPRTVDQARAAAGKGGGGQACAAAGERERGKVRGPSTSARCSCVRL